MPFTDRQAKYLAHELTRRGSSGSMGKLAAAVAGAQVDLNAHQVDAALFAFKSPFSNGAILADEWGEDEPEVEILSATERVELEAEVNELKASSELAFSIGQENRVFISKPPSPLNVCVISGIYDHTISAFGFLHKKLENLYRLSHIKYSKPPAPLNACVIRGVFFCPNYASILTCEGGLK